MTRPPSTTGFANERSPLRLSCPATEGKFMTQPFFATIAFKRSHHSIAVVSPHVLPEMVAPVAVIFVAPISTVMPDTSRRSVSETAVVHIKSFQGLQISFTP
ncbi:hypothetical protein BMS3Bbin07_00193 [bacterium BMS3Bbin07]|nr:hypothetical protein BMS3Bbin07_00193 [bacterium BMS3Bbin07]